MEIDISGFKVLIDDEDFKRVSSVNWAINKHKWDTSHIAYFRRTSYDEGMHYTQSLHRFIMCMHAHDGKIVDHKNGNTLDNRKHNLRICTHTENVRNQRISSKNTTGFKGVTFDKVKNKYLARISVNSKSIHLGRHATAEDAYAAYCEASKKYHGEFGRTE